MEAGESSEVDMTEAQRSGGEHARSSWGTGASKARRGVGAECRLCLSLSLSACLYRCRTDCVREGVRRESERASRRRASVQLQRNPRQVTLQLDLCTHATDARETHADSMADRQQKLYRTLHDQIDLALYPHALRTVHKRRSLVPASLHPAPCPAR